MVLHIAYPRCLYEPILYRSYSWLLVLFSSLTHCNILYEMKMKMREWSIIEEEIYVCLMLSSCLTRMWIYTYCWETNVTTFTSVCVTDQGMWFVYNVACVLCLMGQLLTRLESVNSSLQFIQLQEKIFTSLKFFEKQEITTRC